MKNVKITAIRKGAYPDLMAKYENPIQHACAFTEKSKNAVCIEQIAAAAVDQRGIVAEWTAEVAAAGEYRAGDLSGEVQ